MSITMGSAAGSYVEKGTFQMNYSKDDTCSSSSSIGKNSDSSEDAKDDASNDNRSTFDSLQALEEVLPIRRGISSFYCGKSKSFASLSYLTSSKDIAKPENAYSRKRRNLMASASHVWDNRNPHLHRTSAGGIHKRHMHTSRSSLALGVAMSQSSSSQSKEIEVASSPIHLN